MIWFLISIIVLLYESNAETTKNFCYTDPIIKLGRGFTNAILSGIRNHNLELIQPFKC